MSELLDDLVDLLALEKIEENLFRGRSQDLVTQADSQQRNPPQHRLDQLDGNPRLTGSERAR